MYGAARWRDAAAREPLEAAGVKPVRSTWSRASSTTCRSTVDYVVHFAVVKSGKWSVDLDGNVSGLAMLMERYRRTRRRSCTARPRPSTSRTATTSSREDSPLGDNHRNYYLPTYSICEDRRRGDGPSRRHGATTCRPRSPGSTSRTATAAAGRRSTSRMMEAGQEIGVHADRAERLPADPLRRHRRDGAAAARDRRRAGDDGQLGRRREGQRRGVDGVPRRADRADAEARDRPSSRWRASSSTSTGCTSWSGMRRSAGRTACAGWSRRCDRTC